MRGLKCLAAKLIKSEKESHSTRVRGFKSTAPIKNKNDSSDNMQTLTRTSIILLLLVLFGYLLLAYNSTTTHADYIVVLEEKYQEKNKYWARFYDIFSEVHIEVVVGKDVYEMLDHEIKYKITFKSNDLFKTPRLTKIEVSDLE